LLISLEKQAILNERVLYVLFVFLFVFPGNYDCRGIRIRLFEIPYFFHIFTSFAHYNASPDMKQKMIVSSS